MSQLLELVVPWLQVDDEDVLHPVLLSQLQQYYCTALLQLHYPLVTWLLASI